MTINPASYKELLVLFGKTMPRCSIASYSSARSKSLSMQAHYNNFRTFSERFFGAQQGPFPEHEAQSAPARLPRSVAASREGKNHPQCLGLDLTDKKGMMELAVATNVRGYNNRDGTYKALTERSSHLDFGCGEDAEVFEVVQRGASRVIGIDNRKDVLQVAKQTALDAGVLPEAEYRI